MKQLILSLFPGVGLLDQAFEEEGFTIVRGPDVIWGGDIRSFRPPAGKFDGCIGGPPCQSFTRLRFLLEATGRKPRFGNLIPEFERCVEEAAPAWFLMEQVPEAPTPAVKGYGVSSFLLDNAWLGAEQRRKRRFSFGLRGGAARCLMPWIEQAPLELPRPVGTLTQNVVDNSPEAKGRRQVVARRGSLNSAVLGPHGTRHDARGVRANRYTFESACRLQGLPEDFLSHSPLTKDGKLRAVANGVPLPMGRALARAVKEVLR